MLDETIKLILGTEEIWSSELKRRSSSHKVPCLHHIFDGYLQVFVCEASGVALFHCSHLLQGWSFGFVSSNGSLNTLVVARIFFGHCCLSSQNNSVKMFLCFTGSQCVWRERRGGWSGRVDCPVWRNLLGPWGACTIQTPGHRCLPQHYRRAVRPPDPWPARGARHELPQPAQLVAHHGRRVYSAQSGAAPSWWTLTLAPGQIDFGHAFFCCGSFTVPRSQMCFVSNVDNDFLCDMEEYVHLFCTHCSPTVLCVFGKTEYTQTWITLLNSSPVLNVS